MACFVCERMKEPGTCITMDTTQEGLCEEHEAIRQRAIQNSLDYEQAKKEGRAVTQWFRRGVPNV